MREGFGNPVLLERNLPLLHVLRQVGQVLSDFDAEIIARDVAEEIVEQLVSRGFRNDGPIAANEVDALHFALRVHFSVHNGHNLQCCVLLLLQKQLICI